MYRNVVVTLLTLSNLAFGVVYEGRGNYGSRDIKVYAELNLLEYMTSDEPKVEAYEADWDPDISIDPTFHCSTSVTFPGSTVLLMIEDAKTGEVLQFIDEEPAMLKVSSESHTHEKVECVAADFSKLTEQVYFVTGANLHLPLEKKGGYDVSLALYPLLSPSVPMTLRKVGDRYEMRASEFADKLKAELSLSIIHWKALSETVGTVKLSFK